MDFLEKYNNFINESITFIEGDEDRMNDTLKIEAFIGDDKIGQIILEFVINGFWVFEGELSEEEYEEYFPDDSFIKIQDIVIYDKYKGKGYSKKIIQKALDFIKKNYPNTDVVYLNASPMGFTGLSIEPLVNLYKSFGFKTIISYPDNKEMILNL
jgi:GNAT superfamily N-acetyltransferase